MALLMSAMYVIVIVLSVLIDHSRVLTIVMLNEMPHLLLIFSQSDYLIQVVDTISHT